VCSKLKQHVQMKVAERGKVIWMRNPEWCRKLVPKMRWSMSEGSMSDFERWLWYDQSDIKWTACVVTVRRLNRYEVIKIPWLSGIENYVSERNYFIFNSLRNFKPVKRFQNRSDVFKFWSLDNSSNKSILSTIDCARVRESLPAKDQRPKYWAMPLYVVSQLTALCRQCHLDQIHF